MPFRLRAARFSAAAGGLVASVCLLSSPFASAQPPPPEPLPPLPAPLPPAAPTDAPAAIAPAPPVVVAQPTSEPSPASDESAAAAPAGSPEPSFDDVRYRDAHADRVILGSTAETHPAGTFFFTDYEIVLLQMGYALTDAVQISVAGVPPFVRDQPYFFDFGLKVNVVRTAAFRAAFTGAVDVATDGSTESQTILVGRVGAVGQFCFDDHCRSSLSANLGAAIASDSTSAVYPVYGSLGLIANVSPLVSFLIEPALLGAVPTSNGSGGAGFLFSYGLRIAGPRFGVDLAMGKPVAVTGDNLDNTFILGYPFVAFTYRTDGNVMPPRAPTVSFR
jgi:hypothetical protein